MPGSDDGRLRERWLFFYDVPSGSWHIQCDCARQQQSRYTLYVGVTDIDPGAKTTMGMIAAEALGTPLSNVEVVWGDTDRCPYSVGESGSRTTIMTGLAVVEAAEELKRPSLTMFLWQRRIDRFCDTHSND